jgi:hypothetical protein
MAADAIVGDNGQVAAEVACCSCQSPGQSSCDMQTQLERTPHFLTTGLKWLQNTYRHPTLICHVLTCLLRCDLLPHHQALLPDQA